MNKRIKRIWDSIVRYLRIKAAVWGIIPVSLETMLKLVYSQGIIDLFKYENEKYNQFLKNLNQGKGYKYQIKYTK